MKFRVKIGEKDLFRFMMYHVYHTSAVFTAVIVPLLGVVGCILRLIENDVKSAVFMLVLGIGFSAVFHIDLLIKSKQQAKANEDFSSYLEFEFTDEALIVSQNGESAAVEWLDISKYRVTNNLIMVYTDKIHSYLIPKNGIEPLEGSSEQVSGQMVVDYVQAHVGKK